MNIFATSDDPVICARDLDDRRVIKMALETAQILSTVARALAPEWAEEIGLYRATHARHPCVLWAADSMHNVVWLERHGVALAEEYSHRFRRRHASLGITMEAAELISQVMTRGDDRTPFANCTPYKDEPDTMLAYRRFMADKWRATPPRFTRRLPPTWWLPDAPVLR